MSTTSATLWQLLVDAAPLSAGFGKVEQAQVAFACNGAS